MIDIHEVAVSVVDPVIDAIRAEGMYPDADDGVWFAAMDGETVAGVVRVFERAGQRMLEDMWVAPQRRGSGIGGALVEAARERFGALWLICDEDMIAWYERHGFTVQAMLPQSLIEVCEPKGYWQPPDHLHVAMRFSG